MSAVKKIWKSKEFVALLLSISEMKTVYMSSGTLSDVTTFNRNIFASWCPNAWANGKVDSCIKDVLDKGTHVGTDCNNLFKALVWQYNPKGKKIQPNGAGVIRNSNGLKDLNANDLFNTCTNISTDLSKIIPGEMLWFSGHVGMYYGKIDNVDYVIDATPSLNGVKLNKMSRQKWKKHGQFPWVDYSDSESVLYKLQVGSYALKSNAEKMQKLLQEFGFNAIIKEERSV